MRVLLAQHAGACYGVERALRIAEDVMSSGVEASTLGPLIHNPQVVSDLEKRGIHAASDINDIRGSTAIIRSHGITPEAREALHDAGYTVVDATCPHVARAQKGAAALAEAGCRVLVVGEKGHPEVESLVAYAKHAGAKVDVVCAPKDVPDDLHPPVGVVVQTTQTRENLEAVIAALAQRGIAPTVKDTVCNATRQRQKAAAEVAAQVDAMVVVGGRNSSNTTRLAEICAKDCPRVFHVESPRELASVDFAGVSTVGVSAGASTPESQIEAVVSYLESL